jgi:hypothetical protein
MELRVKIISAAHLISVLTVHIYVNDVDLLDYKEQRDTNNELNILRVRADNAASHNL